MRGWTYVPGTGENDFHVLRLIERKDGMLDLGLTQGFKLCTMPLSSDQAREIGETLIRWAETGRLEAEPKSICKSLLERWKGEKHHYTQEEQEFIEHIRKKYSDVNCQKLVNEIMQSEIDYLQGKKES